MNEHYCAFVNYSTGETTCGKPARFDHGVIWLCAEHYDFVMDYVAGKLDGSLVFGYDMPMDGEDGVFSIGYK